MNKPKILIVLHHPVQNFSESFREAAKSKEFTLDVLYWEDTSTGYQDRDFGLNIEWDTDLLSGYSYHVARGNNLLNRFIDMRRFINQTSPEMIVTFGWGDLATRWTIMQSIVTGIPVALFGDSSWQHATGARTIAHRALRWMMLRILMHAASCAISTGTFNREFYIRYGMNPNKIVKGVCPVDVDSFYSEPRSSDDSIDQDPVVVTFAGKLNALKGVDELLRAVARLQTTVPWELRIIGDGSERKDLELLAKYLTIDDRTNFRGFKNISQMPPELRQTDIFVMPSRLEHRALAVIEAMNAGACAVVSSNTGIWGAGDVVDPGRTGYVYTSGDINGLTQLFDRLIENRDERATVAERGQNLARQQGPREFAQGLSGALSCVRGRRP